MERAVGSPPCILIASLLQSAALPPSILTAGKETLMARVQGLHKVGLRPGVDLAEFERFAVEEVYPAVEQIPGLRYSLLRGEKGDRKGRYLELYEFDSVERWRTYFPEDKPDGSEEMQRYFEQMAPMMAKWNTFALSLTDPTFTDYVVLGE